MSENGAKKPHASLTRAADIYYRNFGMKINHLVWITLLTGALSSTMARAGETSISISGTDAGRLFEGIGAVSAGGNTNLLMDYPEPYLADERSPEAEP